MRCFIINKRLKVRPIEISLLIFLLIFLGLNALFGGGAFIIAPDGHLIKMPFSHLKNTPFPNFLFPGLLLFTFLGLYPILVAYCLWKRPTLHFIDKFNPFKQFHWAWTSSILVGIITFIWIIVQIQWIPIGFLHIFIFFLGVLIILFTSLPKIRNYYKI